MAIRTNIIIDQGTDFEVTINVKDANTSSIDLSGYTANAQMRKYYTSSRAYSFGTSISANTGEVTLAINAVSTANISPGRYVYDCILTSNADQGHITTRIVEGIVTIAPRVTR